MKKFLLIFFGSISLLLGVAAIAMLIVTNCLAENLSPEVLNNFSNISSYILYGALCWFGISIFVYGLIFVNHLSSKKKVVEEVKKDEKKVSEVITETKTTKVVETKPEVQNEVKEKNVSKTETKVEDKKQPDVKEEKKTIAVTEEKVTKKETKKVESPYFVGRQVKALVNRKAYDSSIVKIGTTGKIEIVDHINQSAKVTFVDEKKGVRSCNFFFKELELL